MEGKSRSTPFSLTFTSLAATAMKLCFLSADEKLIRLSWKGAIEEGIKECCGVKEKDAREKNDLRDEEMGETCK